MDLDFTKKLNNIFEYPNKNTRKSKNNNIENYISNDSVSTLNLASLKSLEWDEIKVNPQNNKIDKEILFDEDSIISNPKSEKEKINFNSYMDDLQKLIHPIDDSFEKFINNKINELEILKNGNKIKTRKYIDNANIKINKYNKKGNGPIIKGKNEVFFHFIGNSNKDNISQIKNDIKSFLVNSNHQKYNEQNNNIGNMNKIRLNILLDKVKGNKI